MADAPKQYARKPPTQFPPPPFHTVRDTDRGRNAIKFFLYWKSLDAKFHPLIRVRFYRIWPVIDLKLVEPSRKTIETEIIEGPIPFEPDAYQDWFLRRHGSGEWKAMLNEEGVSGEVMEAYFSAVGDFDQYPPKIDLRTVVRGNFRNEDYIRQLNARNIPLPGDAPQPDPAEVQEKEEQMVVGEAMGTLAKGLVDVTTQRVQAAEEVAEARIRAASSEPPSAESVAHLRGIEIMADAAGKVVDMVTEKAGSGFDPGALFDRAIEFAEKHSAKSDSFAGALDKIVAVIQASNERVVEMQKAQIEFLTRIALERQNPATEPTAIVPAKSFVEQAAEYKQIAELFGWSRGSDNGAHEPALREERAPEKSISQMLTENAVPLMGLVTSIMALGANMVYNYRLKPGETPQSPGEAMQRARQASEPQPQPAANGMYPPQLDPQLHSWWPFINQFESALLEHIFGQGQQLNGYTLAQFVHQDGVKGAAPSEGGRKKYLAIRDHLGRAGFDKLVMAHDGIWSKVKGILPYYQKFMNEFFAFDEWRVAAQAQTMPAAATEAQAAVGEPTPAPSAN